MNGDKLPISTWISNNWFSHIIVPIFIGVVLFLGTRVYKNIIDPPLAPELKPHAFINTPLLIETLSDTFEVDYKSNKYPWIYISIVNIGKSKADNLDIDFSLLKNNRITGIDPLYSSKGIERRVTRYEILEKSFFTNFSSFPVDADATYKIYLENFIMDTSEYDLSIVSDNKDWSNSITYDIEMASFFPFLSETANGNDQTTEKSKSRTQKSGIFIGGYDPLIMANGIFRLLQEKKLISENDATEIKIKTESYNEGILFGGINILKYNEIIINKLILRGRITQSQANTTIEKSKKSGGVLLGGYNVIILQVEILNILLKNGYITLIEGQKIIDDSKQSLN